MSSATMDSMTCVDSRLVLETFAKALANTGDDDGFHFLALRWAASACWATAETEMESAASADADVIRLIPATLYPL